MPVFLTHMLGLSLSAPALRWPLTALYVLLLALIAVYGLHRYWLVWLHMRHCRRPPRPTRRLAQLPMVTVQLPMFNELQVTERVIDAVCGLDYPRARLQIQVLDDSTDRSAEIARQRAAHWARLGVNISYHHRTERRGFKAGALADAMPHATGEFIAIFDADFIPPANFLRRTIHYFSQPRVGMVQARWTHLNRNDSLLTRAQAVYLDAHFLVEHAARAQSGRWMNFNGTAGVWRRAAIETAGGWQGDTLTEDVDLSYRAQLAGWQFVFVPQVTCPAELPPEINAFKAQQHRWTKGSLQVARKLLPTLLRSSAPWRVKVEAFFHLTSMLVYLYVLGLALLLFPALYVNLQPFASGSWGALLWGSTVFALGTASAGAFYVRSQRLQRRPWLRVLAELPLLMAVGVGMTLNNTRAVLEALFGHSSPFERTPKYAASGVGKSTGWLPTPSIKRWTAALELALASYVGVCLLLAVLGMRALVSTPFLALFAVGFGYVGWQSLWMQRRLRHAGDDPSALLTNPAG